MSELAISTDGLVKTYPQARALDGLTLRVPRGSVYGFLGRNGAGKTTTMKILLGLSRATAGAGHVLGFDMRTHLVEILRRTAFVGEGKALYDSLTPAQLVRYNRGFYPDWSDEAAEQYARRFEIPMRTPYAKLSKGNRTKVCLLLALAQNAELLLLDEPTTGLDPVVLDEVLRALIEDHANEGRTIFFSSHLLSEVEQIADWVGILDNGKLLLEARLDDIRSQYRMLIASGNALPLGLSAQVIAARSENGFVRYLLSHGAEDFARQLQQQGATITENTGVSLREVFLALVRKED